jgi:hypothetical protein
MHGVQKKMVIQGHRHKTLTAEASCFVKVKHSHNTLMEAQRGEDVYSSYSFTTSALDGGEWSVSRLCRALRPTKGTPVPIGQEAAWTPQPVWKQWLQEFIVCTVHIILVP